MKLGTSELTDNAASATVSARGFSFSDYPHKVVSLINTATVAAMSREFGQELDPLRFRGNVYVDGLPAWAEFDFLGAGLTIGDIRFEVVKRIQRCAATDVNPRTAERLRTRGFHLVEVDVSELQKAESGVTCMSLIDDRTM